MGTFKLSEILRKVLAAAGVLEDDILAMVSELQARYPDAAPAGEEFKKWLSETIAAAGLSVEAAMAIATQTWSEIASGHPGYNPDHAGGA